MITDVTKYITTGKLMGVVGVAGVAAGLTLGWWIYRPKTVVPQYHQQAIQADGSVILEAKPNSTAKPSHQIPPGSTVERVAKVVVRPRPISHPAQGAMGQTSGPSQPGQVSGPGVLPPSIPCPPVTVDLTLIRTSDQQRRVIASSPDGDILGGVDIPVEGVSIKADPKWTVSGLVGYDSLRRSRVYGGLVSRRVGPFSCNGGFVGQTVFVGVGFSF